MTKPITIYGIKNCDTMKKARAWLDDHGVAYDFHDYKLAGIAKDKLKQWSDELGWETLLNRAGTTFKKLPDGDKEGLNERKALALMLAQPSMIKRPVLDLGGKLLVGFKPDIYGKEVPAKSRDAGLIEFDDFVGGMRPARAGTKARSMIALTRIRAGFGGMPMRLMTLYSPSMLMLLNEPTICSTSSPFPNGISRRS